MADTTLRHIGSSSTTSTCTKHCSRLFSIRAWRGACCRRTAGGGEPTGHRRAGGRCRLGGACSPRRLRPLASGASLQTGQAPGCGQASCRATVVAELRLPPASGRQLALAAMHPTMRAVGAPSGRWARRGRLRRCWRSLRPGLFPRAHPSCCQTGRRSPWLQGPGGPGAQRRGESPRRHSGRAPPPLERRASRVESLQGKRRLTARSLRARALALQQRAGCCRAAAAGAAAECASQIGLTGGALSVQAP